jgi:hypothetical protein
VQRPLNWKMSYDAAMVEFELEDGKRQQRLQAAKNAIIDHLEDSLHGREPLGTAERAQIEDACRTLLLVREGFRAA